MQRLPLSAATLTLAVLATVPCPSMGQTIGFTSERAALRRELGEANLELRHYLQVEHPRQRRHLDAQIQLTEAEVRALQGRLREYRPFTRFSTGNPLNVTIQHTQMCLLDAELRLADLRAERNNLIRFRSDQWRVLEMQAFELRMRLAELERTEELAPPQNAAPAGG
jgi:hypothetical protein